VQRNRILAADAIEEAMRLSDRSDFQNARTTIQKAVDTIQSSVSKDNILCQGLLTDLRECMNRFRDTHSYNQGTWQRALFVKCVLLNSFFFCSLGGLAFAKSAQMQHKQQRAVASPNMQSCYTTSNQMTQQSNVISYKSKKASPMFSSATPQSYPPPQQQQYQQMPQQQQQQQMPPQPTTSSSSSGGILSFFSSKKSTK
jgi:hypothetical protein